MRWPLSTRQSLILLVVLLAAGLNGTRVSSFPEISLLRLPLFVLGLAAYGGTLLWVTRPERFWLALNLLAAAGAGLALAGLASTEWPTQKFPPYNAFINWLPRLPVEWLAILGVPKGISSNWLAGLLAPLLLVLIGVLLWARDTQVPAETRRGMRAGLGLIVPGAALVALYLALSLARGALAALLVGGMLLLWVRNRRWAIGLALALGTAGILAVILLPENIIQQMMLSDFTHPEWFARPSRFEIWAAAVEMIRQSPWSGIGLGAFPLVFHASSAARAYPGLVFQAHNIFLQAALDLGVPGAVAYAALLAAGMASAWRAGGRIAGGPGAGAAYGLAAGVLAFVLFGLLDAIHLASREIVFVWFLLALATAAAAADSPSTISNPPLK